MTRLALVFGLLSAQLLAADPKPTDAEASEIAEVKKLGGKAEIDADLEESARVSVSFEKATDKALVAVAKQPNVGALEIRDAGKLTDAGFAALKELPNLQRLVLSGGAISGVEARAIADLRTLDTLSLGGCKIGDGELAYFKKFKHLKRLDLRDTQVTDRGLKPALEFAKLEELNLSGTAVTDAGVKSLLAVKGLKLLHLSNCKKTTAAGLGEVEEALQKEKRELNIRR